MSASNTPSSERTVGRHKSAALVARPRISIVARGEPGKPTEGSPSQPSPITGHVPAPSDFVFQSPGTFDAAFAVVPAEGYKLKPEEKAYLERLNACVESFAKIPLLEKNHEIRLLRERDVRNPAVKALRTRAEQFARAPRGDDRNKMAIAELYETYRIEGRYVDRNNRIDTIPFTVEPFPKPNKENLKVENKENLYNDISIGTRDVPIPEDKARLKVEIDTVLTVARVVFTEREKSIGWRAWLSGRYKLQVHAARMRLHESVSQLLGIARVGLMHVDPTQAAFARSDLARFKAEFVAREAGTVKNRYLWRLGTYCLLATLPMVVGYSIARAEETSSILYQFRNFFLLAIGTSIGTWLSFSLRRETLTFEQLAVLEEDRLEPSLRVLFMIALTTAVGLLFWTHAVSFGMGGLESKDAIQAHGTQALLIGLLAGIAERALSTAISHKASDFAKSLIAGAGSASKGGTTKP